MFSDPRFLLENGMMSRLFGGSGWITVAVIVGYLLILIFRSEAIRVRSLFLLGGISISLAIVVPSLLAAVGRYAYDPIYGNNAGGGFAGSRGGPGELDFSTLITLGSMVLGPILLGVGLLLTILAALPQTGSSRSTQSNPGAPNPVSPNPNSSTPVSPSPVNTPTTQGAPQTSTEAAASLPPVRAETKEG